MELFTRLSHLWPNLSALSAGTTDGISAAFWLLMTFGFVLALFFVCLHFLRYRKGLRAVESLLAGQTKATLAENRRDILRRAEQLGVADIGELWREFDESLVASADKTQLFNTLDAEHFFNGRTLARGLTASRLLAAAPSFLVAIGVLGTFVGLTIGLADLEVGSSDVEQLKGGIQTMIAGAAVAFLTSVWGVFYSLGLNLIEKNAERIALARIGQLQHRIDFLYPRIPAEQSLVHIAEHTRESREALQELHERIGDRLQESIQGLSDSMQQALTDTLNNIMGPAIQALVTNAGQQSTQALEGLVGRFMEGMTTAGRSQGALMEKAAESVNGAVSEMGQRIEALMRSIDAQQAEVRNGAAEQNSRFEQQLARIGAQSQEREGAMEQRFTHLMATMTQELSTQFDAAQRRDTAREESLQRVLADASVGQQQLLEQVTSATRDQLASIAEGVQAGQAISLRLAEQHQQLLTRLQGVTDAVAMSSKHMDSSANQLGLLSTNLRQASESLGSRLEQVAMQVQQAAERTQQVADGLDSQGRTLDALQGSLLESAVRSEEAARLARDGFAEMRQHQEQFLAGVRTEFTQLGEILRLEVESLEEQAQKWLRAYSTEVTQQISDRMRRWDEESLRYADQMQRAVAAISNIVDGLEAQA
jgi:hypothetical protein